MIEFVAGMIALRRRFTPLRSPEWLSGKTGADGQRDVIWWHPDGREMETPDWDARPGAVGMLLTRSSPEGSEKTPDESLLVLFNRNAELAAFRLPPGRWQQHGDSASDTPFAPRPRSFVCTLEGHSILLLGQENGRSGVVY